MFFTYYYFQIYFDPSGTTDRAPAMDQIVTLKEQPELFSHARQSVQVCGTDMQVGNISSLWQPLQLNLDTTYWPEVATDPECLRQDSAFFFRTWIRSHL